MTLIETVVAVAILGMVALAVFAFQRDFFQLNLLAESELNRETEIRKVMKSFVAEVRGANAADTGAYLIEQAAASSFVLFADIDNNASKERVRYFLSGSVFRKGITKSSGFPPTYNPAGEIITDVAHDVTSANPIFYYYDSSYDGTGPPLADPVDVSRIRIVKMMLTVDPRGAKPPAPRLFSAQSTIRNLRGQ